MKEILYIDNAFWLSESASSLRESLIQAGLRQSIRLIPRSNADFLEADSFKNMPGTCLFWDKDQRLAQLLESEGCRLYNSAEAIRLCDDKTQSYLALKTSNIPMPQTLLCPFTFQNIGFTRTEFIKAAAERLGFPFVIKAGFGSFGMRVYLVHTHKQAEEYIAAMAGEPILFQQFVKESAGRDLRLYVVGSQVVAAMERVNHSGDFRANISGGGTAIKHIASKEEEKIALAACQKLGLDFGGVDLLVSNEGPLLCEVNSNAHFKALRELSGVDPADHIISLIREGLT